MVKRVLTLLVTILSIGLVEQAAAADCVSAEAVRREVCGSSGQFQTWLKIKNSCKCEASATINFNNGGSDFVPRVPALGETEKMIGPCGPNEATWKSVDLEQKCDGGRKSTSTPPNSLPTPTGTPSRQSFSIPASLADKEATIKSLQQSLQHRIYLCEYNNCLQNVQSTEARCVDLGQHGRTAESERCAQTNTENFNICVGECMSANR